MAKQNTLPNSNIRPPFGRKIAELRKSRDMTLAHIAQICGVSEATMSRIETGKTDISAHHLFLLALEFKIDIAEFFDDNAKVLTVGMRSVTKNGQGEKLKLGRFLSEVLGSDIALNEMHPAFNQVSAETLEEVGGLWSHPGQEFLYVLKGAIELHSELYAPLTLEVGDSVYFEGQKKHAYLKSGQDTATILVVVAPVSRGAQ
ncbi:MAG: XRE family transcriptional regulator [Paracoccaceae bacterium]